MRKIETIGLTYYIKHDAYGGGTLYINAPYKYSCKSLCLKHFETDDVVVDDTHAGIAIQLEKILKKQINDEINRYLLRFAMSLRKKITQ